VVLVGMIQKVTKSLSVEEARQQRKWYLVDAEGQTLGRLASRIAAALRGKNNPAFTPHVDCGDFVVVVNAERVRLTGNKLADKMYYRHSGFPGGINEETAAALLARRPEEVIRRAVVGMLPHNRLGRQLATKLKIYAGSEHPHTAQQPVALA
jgi:large subunit ribosomal protein L13